CQTHPASPAPPRHRFREVSHKEKANEKAPSRGIGGPALTAQLGSRYSLSTASEELKTGGGPHSHEFAGKGRKPGQRATVAASPCSGCCGYRKLHRVVRLRCLRLRSGLRGP